MKSIEVEDCTDVPGADSGAYGHGGVPRLSCVVIGRAALADLRICEICFTIGGRNAEVI